MTTTRIGEYHLAGDGPGAAPVTISIDGRDLIVPRCLLIDVLNVAANANHDEEKAFRAKPLDRFIGAPDDLDTFQQNLENAVEELRCYRERAKVCDAISDHLKSR